MIWFARGEGYRVRPMRRIAELIRRSLHLRVFLPLLALALLATWYGLGPSIDRFAALTGGERFVDMQPGLTADRLIEQVRVYSPETVRYYLWWSAFDFAWPLLTFTAMMFMVAWLFRFLPGRQQGLFTLVVAVGYAAVLCDWGENIGFVGTTLSADPRPLAIARAAVAMHVAKLGFLAMFNAACAATLLWALARQIRSRAVA
jgi:hypothetical protein